MKAQALNEILENIAKQHLFVETLETRHSDQLDFHDVSVWGVKGATKQILQYIDM